MILRDDEARLALALSKALDQFSSLLWARYGQDFLKLAEEDNGEEALEENTEVA